MNFAFLKWPFLGRIFCVYIFTALRRCVKRSRDCTDAIRMREEKKRKKEDPFFVCAWQLCWLIFNSSKTYFLFPRCAAY